MEAEANFSQIAPPIFDGESYQLWAVKTETYLEAFNLWLNNHFHKNYVS
jgi:hypothetical protein